MYLAAGQTMLAIFEGTAFYVSYVLLAVAGIMISSVMLRSSIFSKVTAYAGLVGNAIGLGYFVPTRGLLLSLLSVPVLWIWYILIARRFFQLSSSG
jgi:hypothetical protein